MTYIKQIQTYQFYEINNLGRLLRVTSVPLLKAFMLTYNIPQICTLTPSLELKANAFFSKYARFYFPVWLTTMSSILPTQVKHTFKLHYAKFETLEYNISGDLFRNTGLYYAWKIDNVYSTLKWYISALRLIVWYFVMYPDFDFYTI